MKYKYFYLLSTSELLREESYCMGQIGVSFKKK